jgi:hypothetical protein
VVTAGNVMKRYKLNEINEKDEIDERQEAREPGHAQG